MNITESQKERIKNIKTIQVGVSWLGAIGGIVYANRTGGGAFRYLGYFLLGSIAAGIPAQIVGTPFVNKILKESDKNQK